MKTTANKSYAENIKARREENELKMVKYNDH